MNTTNSNSNGKEEKILLMTLPFLTPLIPPVGISCLKSYLQKYGYHVKATDGMENLELRELCYRYFDKLETYIPEEKKGHFFNVGLDVLFNHFMAHINYKDENLYIELVKQLAAKNFFISVDEPQVRALNAIVKAFFNKLQDYVIDLLDKEKPTIMGLSIYKGTLASAVFAARTARKHSPHIKILAGGTIFSQDLFPGTYNFDTFVKRTPEIDKIFIGESEQLFLKYLQHQLPEHQKMYTLKDVDNQLVNLDTLDIPDYSDFDLTVYPLLASYTSRGCIYRCSFCAETVYWKQYNKKKVEKAADEFMALANKYGTRVFILTDCLINPLVTPLSHELIRRKANIYWDVYIKVDNRVCDPAYTHLWRKGGFYRARLGIESGSQAILDVIDKQINLQQIKAAITGLAAAGIKTTTYWIAGHPGESEQDFQATLDLLEELQDDLFEAECDPFRYFHTGQVNAEIWLKEKGNFLLYPEEMTDMLLMQTYVLNDYPEREIIYQRQCRFREHCKKLGIPNPYTYGEIREADERWKALHKNAVPPLAELDSRKNSNETSQVVHMISARDMTAREVDFSF